jgi:hypothetical protein
MDRIELSFTAIGHFAAVLIGLAFYPMARERKTSSWNPAKLRASFRAAYRRSRSHEPQPDTPAPQ